MQMKNNSKDPMGTGISIAFGAIISLVSIACFLGMIFLPEKELTAETITGYSVLDQVQKDEGEYDLTIKLPPQVMEKNITVEEDPAHPYRGFIISVQGFLETDLLDHPIGGSLNTIETLDYTQSSRMARFAITTSDMREYRYKVEDGVFELSLLTPAEVYDHLIVVDAGHGGEDTGYICKDAVEKDISLAITLKLRDYFAEDENIKVFYTRLSDEDIPLSARVGFANEIGADLLVSIHVNSTASGRESAINGASVRFRIDDEDGKSRELSKKVLDEFLKATDAGSKGMLNGDDELVVRSAKVPVCMLECGYITNEEERESLISDKYQDEIAGALHKAIISFLKSEE